MTQTQTQDLLLSLPSQNHDPKTQLAETDI